MPAADSHLSERLLVVVDLSDTPTVFKYLSDDTLNGIAFHDLACVYSYRCGCTAVRKATADHCVVRWCDMQRRKDLRAPYNS